MQSQQTKTDSNRDNLKVAHRRAVVPGFNYEAYNAPAYSTVQQPPVVPGFNYAAYNATLQQPPSDSATQLSSQIKIFWRLVGTYQYFGHIFTAPRCIRPTRVTGRVRQNFRPSVRARSPTQLNSTQQASTDAGETPHCPYLYNMTICKTTFHRFYTIPVRSAVKSYLTSWFAQN